MAAVAYTQLTYRWPDGNEVIIVCGTDEQDRGCPDQLAETKAVALSAYRQIVGITEGAEPDLNVEKPEA